MIKIYLPENEKLAYKQRVVAQYKEEIKRINGKWEYSDIIVSLLQECIDELENKISDSLEEKEIYTPERRIKKYGDWIEVFRLINYQYSRFSTDKNTYFEGLYSTLISLVLRHYINNEKNNISVLGCGPARTALELSEIFKNNTICACEYSILSLICARRIISSKENFYFPKRDINDTDNYFKYIAIEGFGRNNVEYALLDIMNMDKYKKSDLIVCSNVVNLLSNQEEGIEKIVNNLSDNGIIVFADLLNWRIDRNNEQMTMKNMQSIKKSFEKFGIQTLEAFTGGPYIEEENNYHYALYKQVFYVGRKNNK